MSVKSVLVGVAAAMSLLASGAQAATITFDAGSPPPYGDLFFGGGSENGFQYEVQTDGLFLNSYGNPGQDMEGNAKAGGGVLDIRAQDGSLFTFQTLDYAAYANTGVGFQTLTVTGWLNGDLVGADLFKLANVSSFNPKYANWTMFGAENLWGLEIDTLSITLNGEEGADGFVSFQAVDNITFGVSAVPEPATWAMMITGFGLAGVMLRRRRLSALA